MPREELWDRISVRVGQCRWCRHAMLNETRRRTVYVRCLRASWDARLTRYPNLPMDGCPGYQPDREE